MLEKKGETRSWAVASRCDAAIAVVETKEIVPGLVIAALVPRLDRDRFTFGSIFSGLSCDNDGSAVAPIARALRAKPILSYSVFWSRAGAAYLRRIPRCHRRKSSTVIPNDVRHVADRRPFYTDPLPLELLRITIVYVLPRLPCCVARFPLCVRRARLCVRGCVYICRRVRSRVLVARTHAFSYLCVSEPHVSTIAWLASTFAS